MVGLVMPTRRYFVERCALLVVTLAVSCHAFGQDKIAAVVPQLRVGTTANVTANDNYKIVESNEQSALSTDVSIDVHLLLPYKRLRGFVDYELTGVTVRSDRTTHDHRNALSTGLSSELIESFAFLDLSATVGSQFRSAFGQPSRELSLENDNRVESGTLRIAPSLRGRFGDTGRFDARAEESITKYRTTDVGDVKSQTGSLLVETGVRPGALSWKAQLTGSIYDFDAGRRTTEAIVRSDIRWAFDSQTLAGVIVGREGNDFQSSERRYSSLYGLNFEWNPSLHSRLYAESVHRYFGTGHLLTFSQRSSRMAVTLSLSRTTESPERDAAGSIQGSAFDVLFLQLTSVEPDADRRRSLVQDLLRRNGIDPSQQLEARIVTSALLLVDRQDLGVSWTGVRDTLTIGLTHTKSRRIDTLVDLPVGDDLRSNEVIEEQGVQLNWFHRLTPAANLSVSTSWRRTLGSSPTQPTAASRWIQAQWSAQLGRHSSFAFGLRHERLNYTPGSVFRVNLISSGWRTEF